MLDDETGDLILEHARIPAAVIAQWRTQFAETAGASCTLLYPEDGFHHDLCNYFLEDFCGYLQNYTELEALSFRIRPHEGIDNRRFRHMWERIGETVNSMESVKRVAFTGDDVFAVATITSRLKSTEMYMVTLEPSRELDDAEASMMLSEAIRNLETCVYLQISFPYDMSRLLVSLSTLEQCDQVILRHEREDGMSYDYESLLTFLRDTKTNLSVMFDDSYSSEATRAVLAKALVKAKPRRPFASFALSMGTLDEVVIDALSRAELTSTLILYDQQCCHCRERQRPDDRPYRSFDEDWLARIASNPNIRHFDVSKTGVSLITLQNLASCMLNNSFLTHLAFGFVEKASNTGSSLPTDEEKAAVTFFNTVASNKRLRILRGDVPADFFLDDGSEQTISSRQAVLDIRRVLGKSLNLRLIAMKPDFWSLPAPVEYDFRSYAKLTQHGRNYLCADATNRSKAIELLGNDKVRDDLDCLYAHLHENPQICGKAEVATSSRKRKAK